MRLPWACRRMRRGDSDERLSSASDPRAALGGRRGPRSRAARRALARQRRDVHHRGVVEELAAGAARLRRTPSRSPAVSFRRSHLLAAMTTPRPAASASPAMAASWSVAPTVASTTSTTTSASSMARSRQEHAERLRAAPRHAPGLRMPAVSTMRTSCDASADASTASRVVPAPRAHHPLLAQQRSPGDLPAFGRPTMATDLSPANGRRGPLLRRRASRRGAGARRRRLTTSSSRSPTPRAVLRPDLDDRVEPQLVELDGAVAGPPVVGLVDGGTTGRPVGRGRRCAMSWSPGTRPSRPSTTKTKVGGGHGALPSPRRRARAAGPRCAPNMPPVSIRRNRRLPRARCSWRRGWCPAIGVTMARRDR